MAWYYLLIAPVAIAVCSAFRWVYWVRFNRWLFEQTRDPAAFEQAAKVAESYRFLAPLPLGKHPGMPAIEGTSEPVSEPQQQSP